MTEGELEEPLESGQDFIFDKHSRMRQRRDDWQPSDLVGRSVTENWHQRKFGIHLHFGTSLTVAHLEPDDYCAHFEVPSEAFLASQASGSGGRQGSMLVPIVDYRYVPEECGFRPLPAVVRLRPLHCCPYSTRNPYDVALRPDKEPPPPIHQRELDMSLLRFRAWSGEQEHQVIERGSEVVGSVSDEDAQDRGHGLSLDDLDGEPAFMVLLRSKSIEVRLQERMGRIVHRMDVLSCPPELPFHGV